MSFSLTIADVAAVVAALAAAFCVWTIERLKWSLEREGSKAQALLAEIKSLERDSSKTHALLAEIRDKLGK